eukprot:105838_1
MELLNCADVERNLNIVKNQLDLCLDDILEDICFYKFGDLKEEGNIEVPTHKATYQQKWNEDEDQMLEDIHKYIKNGKLNWSETIQNVNNEFQQQFMDKTKDQQLENVKSIDITKFKLPLFAKFVFKLFIESDKKMYERNKDHFTGVKDSFYRIWIDDFRDVPDWFTYQHDVLLLELVMRNGMNIDLIIDDLTGDKSVEYKIRLGVDKQMLDVMSVDNPYYLFISWCVQKPNILHRLKYVTNIMITTLQNDEYQPSLINIRIPNDEDQPALNSESVVFSDYQHQVHIQCVERKPTTIIHDKSDINDVDEGDEIKLNEEPPTMKQSKSRPFKMESKEITVDAGTFVPKSDTKRYRISDPFLSRNIDNELLATFQSFNLMEYGKPLGLFIISQLRQEDNSAYWKVLGALLTTLPYPISKEIIHSEKHFFTKNTSPDMLRTICMKMMEGSQFQPSAALGIAGFFDDLAEEDLIQEDAWKGYGDYFEKMAFTEINKIESNHLLYTLLNIPLLSNEKKSLVELALDGKRIEFLNNDRINSIMHHMFVHGYLHPGEEIETTELEYMDMLIQLWKYPLDFYLSARGYHWTSIILFMLYFAVVCLYAIARPMERGDLKSLAHLYLLELIFWICNGGYVLYECFELWEKGPSAYFNLGVKGQTNLLDAVLCVFWIYLFITRCYFYFGWIDFDPLQPSTLH